MQLSRPLRGGRRLRLGVSASVLASRLNGKLTGGGSGGGIELPTEFPTLTPGAGYAGAATAAPLANPVPFMGGATQDYERSAWGGILNVNDDATLLEPIHLTIQVVTLAEGGLDLVEVGCEGNVVEAPFGQNPDDGTWGHIVRLESRPDVAGFVTLWVRATPRNGLQHIYSMRVCLNTNGLIQSKVHYVRDPAGPAVVQADGVFGQGNDTTGNGSAAAPFATFAKALDSYTYINASTEAKTRICIVDLGPGEFIWTGNAGRLGGNPRNFTYGPIFRGKGRTLTKLTTETLSTSYEWKNNYGGPVPKIEKLWLDLGQWATSKTCGGWIDDCRLTERWGPRTQINEFENGLPRGLHWSECSPSAGHGPGNIRFKDNGKQRWAVSNSDVDLWEFGTVHRRWNNYETASYDIMFVQLLGDYFWQNNVQRQIGQGEARAHASLNLTVVSATNNGTNTTITFAESWDGLTAGDAANQFVRVVQSANGVPAGNVPYPISPDGSQLTPFKGWQFVSQNVAGKSVTVAGVLDLVEGDLIRAYGIAHGDAGQINPRSNLIVNADVEVLKNIVIIGRTVLSDNWQPLLWQSGWLENDGSKVSAGPTGGKDVFTAITVSGSGDTMEFSPALPANLKKGFFLIPRDGLNTYVFRRIKAINGNQVTIQSPFPNNGGVIPAGTTFSIRAAVEGWIEVDSILHKAGYTNEIAQIETGVFDCGLIRCTIPGYTANNQSLAMRSSGANVSNGGSGGFPLLKFIDCLMFRAASGGGSPSEVWPVEAKFQNCHLEFTPETALVNNSVIGTLGTGYAFGRGIGDPLWARSQNYEPRADVVTQKAASSALWPIDRYGVPVVDGVTRIGASALVE